MEFTLLLIKPDGFKHRKEIIQDLQKLFGLTIKIQKPIELSKSMVSQFYEEHAEQAFFSRLVEHMTSGPVLPILIYGDNTIQTRVRNICGFTNPVKARITQPQSLRARYGTKLPLNAVHASDSFQAAQREWTILQDVVGF